MADRGATTSQQHPHASLNPPSSAPHLRHRPLGRAATFSDTSTPPNRRRPSLFSDSVSEARNSIRSSTDDILLPRANGSEDLDPETSHLHSAPLVLALLPAVGGLLFTNGSAHVTDVTLLLLAAIFLNWSVRLPWDWYRSAQSIRLREPDDPYFNDLNGTILEEDDEEDSPNLVVSPSSESPPPLPTRPGRSPARSPTPRPHSKAIRAAKEELHYHELLALVSCFVFPAIGAWLLHHIRHQLTRPAEGLVSNYNLSIFLLSAEIRPVMHLIKMIQARTLYLQKVVTTSPFEHERIDSNKVLDMAKRLEELEAHVAEKSNTATQNQTAAEASSSKTAAQVTSEVKKTLSPEIDALNRAVRRYEKRTTIQTIQTESRLQELETRMKDAIALAAAAQRGVQGQRQRYAAVLLDWICACVVLPLQALWGLILVPSRLASSVLSYLRSLLGMRTKKERGSSRHGKSRERERERDTMGKGAIPTGRGTKKML